MDDAVATRRTAAAAWTLVVAAVLCVVASQQVLFVPVARTADCFVADQYRETESVVGITLSLVAAAAWLGAVRLSQGRRGTALVAGIVTLGLVTIATAAVIRFVSLPLDADALAIRESCGVNEGIAGAIALLLLTPIAVALAPHLLQPRAGRWSTIRWILIFATVTALWVPYWLIVGPFAHR